MYLSQTQTMVKIIVKCLNFFYIKQILDFQQNMLTKHIFYLTSGLISFKDNFL